MFNRIILIGRLTRDPELKYSPQGTAIATFTLAINRKFNKEETDFIDIVAWKGLAENCANYLGKGRLAAIEGRLQIRSYETKEGQKRKVAEIVADDVRFLDRGDKPQGESSRQTNQQPKDDMCNDIGREVQLDDLDVIIRDEEDEIPF